MQIIKNRLETDGVPSLTVKSENYQIRIFYNGDYKKDSQEKMIDNNKITISCEILDNKNVLPLTIQNGIVTTNSMLPIEVPVTKMDTFLDQILRTRDEMADLQKIYNTYFNPG